MKTTRMLIAALAAVSALALLGCGDYTGDQVVGFNEISFTVHNQSARDVWIFAIDDDGSAVPMRPIDRGDSFTFVESDHWEGKRLEARCNEPSCQGAVLDVVKARDDVTWNVPFGLEPDCNCK